MNKNTDMTKLLDSFDDLSNSFKNLCSKMEHYIADIQLRADKLSELYNSINEVKKPSLSKYIDAINDKNATNYFLDEDGDICSGNTVFFDNLYNPYNQYPTEKLADKAARTRKFNDILLALKYVYDNDYNANWEDSVEKKYIVIYKTECDNENYINRYAIDCVCVDIYNPITFSSCEVAEKVVEFLNELDPKGELIK